MVPQADYLCGWRCVLACPIEVVSDVEASASTSRTASSHLSSERCLKRKRFDDYLPRTVFVSPEGRVSSESINNEERKMFPHSHAPNETLSI